MILFLIGSTILKNATEMIVLLLTNHIALFVLYAIILDTTLDFLSIANSHFYFYLQVLNHSSEGHIFQNGKNINDTIPSMVIILQLWGPS